MFGPFLMCSWNTLVLVVRYWSICKFLTSYHFCFMFNSFQLVVNIVYNWTLYNFTAKFESLDLNWMIVQTWYNWVTYAAIFVEKCGHFTTVLLFTVHLLKLKVFCRNRLGQIDLNTHKGYLFVHHLKHLQNFIDFIINISIDCWNLSTYFQSDFLWTYRFIFYIDSNLSF